MRIKSLFATLAVLGWVLPVGAATSTRRATIVGGGGGQGNCTIEVEVDGAAEVAISGDTGRLRTLSGQTAQWRRFECNGQIPRNPVDFRFRGIDGRGRVDLVSDPRNNGVAVVRIEDTKGGREGYTFVLEWAGGSYGSNGPYRDNNGSYRGNNGPYRDNNGSYDRYDDRVRRNDRYGREDGYGYNRGSDSVAGNAALSACRDAITQRIDRDGYTRVNILSAQADNNPGRNDHIFGRATARGRSGAVNFDFTCSMNLSNGRVRSVELNPR